jgi:hypothetical protein
MVMNVVLAGDIFAHSLLEALPGTFVQGITADSYAVNS